jgi:mannosyltransferase OCH1-like enzyme
MIPKIFHFCSRDYSWEERKIIEKTRKRAPNWQIIEWTDNDNDAFVREQYPAFADRYFNMPKNVMRVDIMRCLYIHYYGGVYIDTDYIISKNPDETLLDSTILLGIEENVNQAIGGHCKYGNAFLASIPKLDFWLEFIDSAFDRYEAGEKNIVYIAGPHALSKFLVDNPAYNELVTPLEQEVIYPDFNWHKITTNNRPDTFGAHLCWGSWRNKPTIQKVKNYSRRVLSSIIM